MPDRRNHPRYSVELDRVLTPSEWVPTNQNDDAPNPTDEAIESLKQQVADVIDRLDRTPNAAKSRMSAKPSL